MSSNDVVDLVDRRTLLTGAFGSVMVSPLVSAQTAGQERWLNQPKIWSWDGLILTMRAEPKADFWRKTFFGYVTDNGYFISRPVAGDFSVTVNVADTFVSQYDQAGLMVRLDSNLLDEVRSRICRWRPKRQFSLHP